MRLNYHTPHREFRQSSRPLAYANTSPSSHTNPRVKYPRRERETHGKRKQQKPPQEHKEKRTGINRVIKKVIK